MKEFEDIIDEIGGHGYFQQRLLYGALGPLFFLLPFTCLIEIFALNIPKHWCKHPEGIINLDKWKDCYLPLEDQPDGTKAHSSCMMYSYDDSHSCPGNSSQIGGDLVNCDEWSFDTSVFVRTTVSDNSWFCDRGQYITDAFFAGTVGAIIGVVTFNNLSDVIGRKYGVAFVSLSMLLRSTRDKISRPVFWFTMALTVIFGIGRAFVSHIFWMYFMFKVISSSCIMAIFQVF